MIRCVAMKRVQVHVHKVKLIEEHDEVVERDEKYAVGLVVESQLSFDFVAYLLPFGRI